MKKVTAKNKTKNKAKNNIGKLAVHILGYTCGIFIFILFFSYFIRQFVFPEGVSPRVLAILVSCASSLPLIIYPFLRKLLPRLAFVLLCIYTVLALFFCVTFVIHLWDTFFFPAPDAEINEIDDGAVILVFGAKVQGTQPARPLAKRLDKAAEILHARPDTFCIVSGGQGADEIMPEAEVMKNYLVNKGIDAERIITEASSHNTVENIANSSEILKLMGYDGQVACVSTSFHMPRIRKLMARAGFGDVLSFSADSPTPASLFFSLIREYCSRAKLLLDK